VESLFIIFLFKFLLLLIHPIAFLVQRTGSPTRKKQKRNIQDRVQIFNFYFKREMVAIIPKGEGRIESMSSQFNWIW